MHRSSHPGLIRILAVVVAAACCPPASRAAESDEALELFEKQIRPTLIEHCVRCHGPDKQQGGLRLDSRQGWAEGGDSGAAIVAGDSASLLLSAIGYEDPNLEMPPRGKLPDKTIEAFQRWVELGAVDPRSDDPSHAASDDATTPSIEEGKSFWSFQPVEKPARPQVENEAWCTGEIDRFVLARLEEQGIQPGLDADRRVLIRRLFYDLIGLPPTPAQIDQFLNDRSPNAYRNLVDRLLDSQHFGERWGRHWLDVVRYAESSGGGRTLLLPDAWRYRDYVIESFNEDVPYDQFVTEQIAGDLLTADNLRQRRRNLIATAFLLLGPTNYEMQDKQILEMDVVDEQLDTMGKALLGMTLGCARCHDHKFDPIPARDYYALAGILKSTACLVHSNVSSWNTAKLPLDGDEAAVVDQYNQKLAAAKLELEQANQRWLDAGGNPKQKNRKAKLGAASVDPKLLSGIVIDDTQAERIGDWTESTSISRYVGGHYIHDGTELKGSKSVIFRPELEASGEYEVRLSYSASSNRSKRVPVHVHHRDGESVIHVNQKQRPSIDNLFVSLGVFQFDVDDQPKVVVSTEGSDDGVVIADAVIFLSPEQANKTERRRDKATDNAPRLAELEKEVDRLTERVAAIEKSAPHQPVVMATRDGDQTGDIHLAIRGLAHQKGELTPRGVLEVASWEDFPEIPAGQSGRKQLAEWLTDARHPLTARVMANRVWYWLVGQGIVPTVDNFGSMGQPPTHPQLLDYLASAYVDSGWSTKQLIREIVNSRVYRLSSASSGTAADVDPDNKWLWRMNRKRLRAEDIRDSLLMIGGSLDLQHGGSNIEPGTKSEYGYRFTSTRRSVYLPVFRNTLPEIFEVFDFADPNIQGGRRASSTIASQALLMMNHPQVIEQSQRAAEELLSRTGLSDRERIELAYLEVLGREPSEKEGAVAVELVSDTGENEVDPVRWSMLYQVLFQCLEFRYLD